MAETISLNTAFDQQNCLGPGANPKVYVSYLGVQRQAPLACPFLQSRYGHIGNIPGIRFKAVCR
jgi:hypothetical protein